jgi:hypothetical protein
MEWVLACLGCSFIVSVWVILAFKLRAQMEETLHD